MKHKGLGKGLGALIPERPVGPDNLIQTIPLGQIKPGIHQPRHTFNNDKIIELADSIRENGIIQPVVLRPIASGFELVAGERRWRAAKLAGLQHVPAIIRKLDDRQALEISLIENLQRDDLNAIEAAKGYKVLLDEHGLTQEVIARVVGKKRATIANTMRLLNLPEQVKNMIEQQVLTPGHAKVLLSLKDDSVILAMAEQTAQFDWSVRMLEDQIKKALSPVRKTQPASVVSDPNLDAVLSNLRQRYSTKIQCVPKKSGGGRIVMDYYDLDDLNRLIELLSHTL